MDLLFFFGSVIVITDKMEETMDYYAVKFLVELGPIFDCIIADGVDTDEEVSRKFVAFTIIKGDDVGEIVMLKIAYVDIKDVIVGTKYYVNIADGSDFASSDKLQPTVCSKFILENKLDIFTIVPDHASKFPQIYNYYFKKFEMKIIIYNFGSH